MEPINNNNTASNTAGNHSSGSESHNPNNSGGHHSKMYRDHNEAIIAGVCSGIAAYYKTDVLLVRIAFIIFTLFGGLGIILYIVGIAVIPPVQNNPGSTGHHHYSLAEDINKHMAQNHNSSHAILGLFIIIVGILFLIDNYFPGFGFDRLWPIILILVGLLVAFRSHPNKS
jgi:phage shock protein C